MATARRSHLEEEIAIEHQVELKAQRDGQLCEHLLGFVEARKLVELAHLPAERLGYPLTDQELVDIVSFLPLEVGGGGEL